MGQYERGSERRVCTTCGIEFDARVIKINGNIHWTQEACDSCNAALSKKLEEEAERKRLMDLKSQAEKEDEQRKADWASILPTKFIGVRLDSFNRKLQPKAFDLVSQYNGKSFILLSPSTYGVGKTHLVCGLAQDLINKTQACVVGNNGRLKYGMRPVYFVTEPELLARIRATFNRHEEDAETEEDIYNTLSDFQLLIIDDVGKVQPKDRSFLQSVYYRIIDRRYVEERPIVLTSNLSYTDFEAHIGGASFDRFVEMCGDNIIKMTGKSYRGSK